MKTIYKIILFLLVISIVIVGGIIVFRNNDDKEIEKQDVYNLVLFGSNNITLKQGQEYDEPGFYAILNSEIVTNDVTIINNVKDEPGTYTIAYIYKDLKKERTITVEENEIASVENAINLSLIGESTVTVKQGSEYKELNAKATYGKTDISNLISISGTVDVKTPGKYTLTYTVEYNGESKSIERVVEVISIETLTLDITYNKNFTNQNVLLGLTATGTDFLYIKLPNNIVTTNKQEIYEVKENGKYTFTVYDKNNQSVTKEVNITNIDKAKPTGSCNLTAGSGKTTITVSASDNLGIDHFVYNSKYTSTSKTYTINETLTSATVDIYDKAGNTTKITCGSGSGSAPVKNSNIEMHFIVSTSDDDAILIRTDSATIMIDGGRYDKNHKVISYLNKIGVKKIDLLIGSHIQYNHVQEQGPIIDTFSVSKAIYSIDIKNCKKNSLCDSNDIKYVLDSINKKNVPVEVKYPGDVMQVGDMKLYFLGPLLPNKKHNKNSFIFILEQNGKKYMFTGDWETDDKKLSDNSKFQEYANKMGISLDVDFFKWPHHGINKVTDAFFSLTKTEDALVPNFHGCSNLKKRSGGDSQMKKLGITYYELCDGVNVVLESDGKTISMKKVSDPSSYYR